jgi:hypothetical protein
MFNFSANHLFLLSRTEYRKCAVFTAVRLKFSFSG